MRWPRGFWSQSEEKLHPPRCETGSRSPCSKVPPIWVIECSVRTDSEEDRPTSNPVSQTQAGRGRLPPFRPRNMVRRCSRTRAASKGSALGEPCGVGTIWTGYVNEPVQGLCVSYETVVGGCGDLFTVQLPRTNPIRRLPCLVSLLSAHVQRFACVQILVPLLARLGRSF